MSELTIIRPIVTPKYKDEFYQIVPHLYDKPIKYKGKEYHEVEICWAKKKGDSGLFLNQEGDKFWHFRLGSIVSPNEPHKSTFLTFANILKAQGQQDDILMDEDGNVLDGYARWFACLHNNVQPKFHVVPDLGDDAAKITFIRSRKLARHNLTEKERMAIVSAEIQAHPTRSNSWTAELLGVSRNTVIKYRRALEESGQIKGVKTLIGKDGSQTMHEPKKRLTATEKEQKNQKRAQEAEWNKLEEARELLKAQLLDKNAMSESLRKIVQFLDDADLEGDEQVNKLREALNKAAPSIKDKDLDKENVYTSLNRIKAFLTDHDLQPSEWMMGSLVGVKKAVDTLLPPQYHPDAALVSATASASWNVRTVAMDKNKVGLSIKFPTKEAPNAVDVVQGVTAGQLSIGGKVINLASTRAILLLPSTPKDATVERPSDADSDDGFDGEEGTVDPSSAVG